MWQRYDITWFWLFEIAMQMIVAIVLYFYSVHYTSPIFKWNSFDLEKCLFWKRGFLIFCLLSLFVCNLISLLNWFQVCLMLLNLNSHSYSYVCGISNFFVQHFLQVIISFALDYIKSQNQMHNYIYIISSDRHLLLQV